MAQAPTPISYGSRGSEVSKLQSYLKNLGLYGGKVEGIWGPKTQSALTGFQKMFGLNSGGGYDAATRNALTQVTSDPSYQLLGDPLIRGLMSQDPRFAGILTNTIRSGGAGKALLVGAHKANNSRVAQTGFGHQGDLFLTGNPEQDDVFWKSATKDLEPDYKQGLDLYKADFGAGLQKQKQDYEAYLQQAQAQLSADKSSADINEAQSGTLFSTGRGQRRASLAESYNQDIQGKQRDTQYNIGNLARGFEEQYGSDAAGDYNYSLPTGSVDPKSLGYSSGTLRRAYRPVGDIYGSKRRDYQYQRGQLAQKKRYAPYITQ